MNKLKVCHILINILFYTIIYIFQTFLLKDNILYDKLLFLSIMSLLIFVVNIYFYKIEYKYIFLLIMINISIICFYFGQSYVYIFTKKTMYFHYFSQNNNNLILTAYYSATRFLICFNIGIVIGDMIFKRKNKRKQIMLFKYSKILIKFLIIFNILIISYISYVFFTFKYEGVRNIKFLIFIYKELRYFNVFYIFFLIGNKKNKDNKIYKFIYLLLSILLLTYGSREISIGMLVGYCGYSFIIENKKVNYKVIIMGLGIMSLVVIFADLRTGNKITNLNLFSVINKLLNELGFTINTMIISLKNLNISIKPRYGFVFIEPIVRLLKIDKILSFKIDYLSDVITNSENVSWGLGSSLLAEGYVNFEKYMDIFSLLIGIFYSRFLIVDGSNDIKKFLGIISIGMLCFSFRSDFTYIFLNLFYFSILPSFMFFIVSKGKRI